MRGLKHEIKKKLTETKEVAPRAGAWIETALVGFYLFNLFVAPRAGAWIETL